MNGPSTLTFPQDSDRFKNTLRIIRRDNSCFDFGSWGVALADAKKRLRLVNVILMNASVRGPFLPAYAHSSNWVDGLVIRRRTVKDAILVRNPQSPLVEHHRHGHDVRPFPAFSVGAIDSKAGQSDVAPQQRQEAVDPVC